MTFKLHLRQKIYISIFLAVAIALLVIHACNPTFDHNREALFALSMILPGVIPWSLFNGDAKRANGKFIIICLVYGSLIVWLGKTSVFAFFFDLGLSHWAQWLVQAIVGSVVFFILFLCARYSSELEALENI